MNPRNFKNSRSIFVARSSIGSLTNLKILGNSEILKGYPFSCQKYEFSFRNFVTVEFMRDYQQLHSQHLHSSLSCPLSLIQRFESLRIFNWKEKKIFPFFFIGKSRLFKKGRLCAALTCPFSFRNVSPEEVGGEGGWCY